MIKSGMVSVTYRKKTPEEIIAIASKAKLDAIEWGSDVHVPPGNVKAAKEIYEKTIAAGLEVASYGSYYMLGEGDFSGFFRQRGCASRPQYPCMGRKK